MLNELFHEAVPLILHEDDLNAMYYSIENRSPFLSRDLFEFCNSIPTRHLMRDGFTKVVLRDSMRGIVPDPILDSRRKVGFNAPLHSLIDLGSAETRESLLKPSPIFEHIRRDKIKPLMEKASLPNSESKFLFYFLSAKLFLEEFAS
jgi:asparagine synthase (glutamine-hydrolysing)